MKMLFSSSDHAIVEQFGRRLMESGIACEIRRPLTAPDKTVVAYYPELWIQKESDFQTATLLLASRGRARR